MSGETTPDAMPGMTPVPDEDQPAEVEDTDPDEPVFDDPDDEHPEDAGELNSQPLLTIGAVFTSIKLAVTAVIGVIVIGAGLPDDLGEQIILAAGLVVVAVGDTITYFLTQSRVTSVESPNLPIGTIVNANAAAPTGVVEPVQPA